MVVFDFFIGLAHIFVVWYKVNKSKWTPRYRTQELPDWKCPNNPYMRALEKKNMTCLIGYLPLIPAEKVVYNKAYFFI